MDLFTISAASLGKKRREFSRAAFSLAKACWLVPVLAVHWPLSADPLLRDANSKEVHTYILKCQLDIAHVIIYNNRKQVYYLRR